MKVGNAIVGQSGGPTAVINASLAGVVEGVRAANGGGRIFGMRYGIEGFLEDLLVDLSAQPAALMERIARTPSSALGSCRLKLKDEHLPRILEKFKKYDIHTFYLIGGNDTMDTIHRVEAYCAAEGYELIGVGIPKTVDNDLWGTDHTPGFGSAATYVARSVAQAGRLARDMQRVDKFVIFQTVGRSAGWLPAAAALARSEEADPPHLIYMPERPFIEERFLADVSNCIDRYGFCAIVCGEGITFEDGSPVSAARASDKFGNVEFGAMGGSSAAITLHQMISKNLGVRGEFQIPESLQMCGADRVSALDREEAMACGREAARLAAAGKSGVMVTLERPAEGPYQTMLGTASLADVAVRARPMPDEFIDASGHYPTAAFLDYVRPLVAGLDEMATLDLGAGACGRCGD